MNGSVVFKLSERTQNVLPVAAALSCLH